MNAIDELLRLFVEHDYVCVMECALPSETLIESVLFDELVSIDRPDILTLRRNILHERHIYLSESIRLKVHISYL